MIELVIVSRLLEYPDAALWQHQQELFDAIAASETLPSEDAYKLGVFLRRLDLVQYAIKHGLIRTERVAHEGLGYLNQFGKALGLKFAAAEGDGRLFGGCRHLGCPCHIRRIGSQAGIPKALCLTYGAHNVAYLAHKHVIFEPGHELVDKLHGRGQITGGSVCVAPRTGGVD